MALRYRNFSLSLRLTSMMLLWSLFLLLASASGQTTLTEEEMFQTHVVQFEDKENVIGESVPTIRAIIESTLRQVIKVVPLTAVRIIVVPDPKRTIPNYGIGGYTPNANTVFIYLDLAFPEFSRVVSERLPSTLVHEFHHCMRWRGPGYGRTLFEALITEGLAEHFALELLGASRPWSNAFPREETAKFLALAQPEFDSTTYNHPRWFFGRDHTLPRWTGYTLGFRLVEAYKEQHPGATAVTLVHMPARVFRPQ
jgi:uncharacterized protein YjaZ